ncbi:hypothetical protein KC19_12G021900 [Ceratodon purpureus]|uniref:Uncharacterized protein n=1 Tax=Ceratodon purpureus TaxID=3225 RepID=A0A8T0G528_CERPU|nr:hypothetical protein KC19_12G021900 [Ceratodon purpureus]
MARWLENASAHGVAATPNVVALLATVIVFFACVTKLVALCAAHGSPQVLNRESEPEGELSPESKKLSQRFSPSTIQAKLSSFRKSSFRNSSSFRSASSFRMDCSQVDVVDAIQRVQPAQESEPEEAPGTPAVWQKQILRGERCAPLEFSGLILYDEKGNPLQPHNNRRPLRS